MALEFRMLSFHEFGVTALFVLVANKHIVSTIKFGSLHPVWNLFRTVLQLILLIQTFQNQNLRSIFSMHVNVLLKACSHWVQSGKAHCLVPVRQNVTGVYIKFSGRLSEESFPRLIQKFPCILIFKTGQPGCQINLSEGQIRLDLKSGRPLV